MTLTIDQLWLTFLISVVLPALVALVTKQTASPALKAVVLAALSAITGVVTSIAANGGSFDVKDALVAFFISFITAVAAHFGLLEPTGLTGSDGAIAESVPRGIG